MVTKSDALVQIWDCNYNKFCMQKLPTSLLMTSLKRKQILKYTHISNIIKLWLVVKSEYHYICNFHVISYPTKIQVHAFKTHWSHSLTVVVGLQPLHATQVLTLTSIIYEPSNIASIQNTISVFLVELPLITWPNNFVSHHKCKFKLF